MEMVSEIDAVEGRSSSDLIKAAIVAMGLRAGWRVFVVLLVGGALDVEVVRPRREPLLSSLPSLQLWGLPATGGGSSSARYWPLWSVFVL